MRSVKFILDKPKSFEPTYIFLKFLCTDGKFKYSTEEKILPGEWNFKLQRAVKNKVINRELDRLESIVDNYIITQKKLQLKTSRDELRQLLNKLTHREKPGMQQLPDVGNFISCFEKIIDEAKEGKLLTPKEKKKYSQGSIRTWENVKERFKEFNPDMKISDITVDTYNDFIIYCNNRGWGKNYTGALVKVWKVILSIGLDKKWHNNFTHKLPEFKTLSEKVDMIYLNTDEINKLYTYDLSGSKYLETIRDRYIVNLFNGLRISDMKTVEAKNINGGTITHINKKTKKKVVIPVHQIVSEIIEKYGGTLPKQYHEAVVNREIKKIAKAAGLTEKFRFTKTIAGITTIIEKERWELITNHTSRRSMATNILKHVNMHEAQPVLGMSLKTLQHYNKITAEENAELLKNNSFFKK